MLLKTRRGPVNAVEAYRPVDYDDTVAIDLGYVVVRDDQNRPLAFAVAYARMLEGNGFVLLPIITYQPRADGLFHIVAELAGGEEAELETTEQMTTVNMLMRMKMVITDARSPEIEAVRVFQRSPLYQSQIFWLYMWTGIGHVMTVVVEKLPALGITDFDINAWAYLRSENHKPELGSDLKAWDIEPARFGHFIGFFIASEYLREHYEGLPVTVGAASDLMKNVADRLKPPSPPPAPTKEDA